MNMFKKTGGFTLVELIVVIAILAILAGVAVPAYSGYIKKAQQAGDLSTLNAVQTAVNAVYATEDNLPTTIKVTEPGTVVVEGTGVKALEGNLLNDFYAYYGTTAANFKLDLASVTDGTTVTWTYADGWDLG